MRLQLSGSLLHWTSIWNLMMYYEPQTYHSILGFFHTLHLGLRKAFMLILKVTFHLEETKLSAIKLKTTILHKFTLKGKPMWRTPLQQNSNILAIYKPFFTVLVSIIKVTVDSMHPGVKNGTLAMGIFFIDNTCCHLPSMMRHSAEER